MGGNMAPLKIIVIYTNHQLIKPCFHLHTIIFSSGKSTGTQGQNNSATHYEKKEDIIASQVQAKMDDISP